jgi:hypothetical protein
MNTNMIAEQIRVGGAKRTAASLSKQSQLECIQRVMCAYMCAYVCAWVGVRGCVKWGWKESERSGDEETKEE